MQQSLPDTIIDWTIFAIQTFGTVPFGLQVVPFVSDEKSETDRLIIKVELGEQLLEADQSFMATMTWKFITAQRVADVANDVWAKLEAAIVAGCENVDSAANARGIATFSRLDFLTENATSSLDNTTNLREYSRTIPLHAKLL